MPGYVPVDLGEMMEAELSGAVTVTVRLASERWQHTMQGPPRLCALYELACCVGVLHGLL